MCKYINIDDLEMEYVGDIELEEFSYQLLEIDKSALKFQDNIYPYKGVAENKSLELLDEESYGIYYNLDDEEFVVIGDSPYTINDIYEIEPEDSSSGFVLGNDLLNDIKSIKNDENIKKKKKANKKSTTQRANDFIRFEINDEDDLMVRLIKERINECNITMNDVYEKYPTEGYNLYYGLLNRNTITFKSMQKWCEITNSEFEMSIKDR